MTNQTDQNQNQNNPVPYLDIDALPEQGPRSRKIHSRIDDSTALVIQSLHDYRTKNYRVSAIRVRACAEGDRVITSYHPGPVLATIGAARMSAAGLDRYLAAHADMLDDPVLRDWAAGDDICYEHVDYADYAKTAATGGTDEAAE